MSDTTTFTFPAATPGADSVSVKIQKGVRYIGRVDTDGPAVWEAICSWMGVDSLNPNVSGLSGMFRKFFDAYVASLPETKPAQEGMPFRDGNFLMVTTDGTPQVDPALPWFLRTLFTAAASEYFNNLPAGAPTSGVSLDGNFVVVPED